MNAKPTSGPWEWDAGDAGQDYSAPYCTVSKDGGELIIAEVNDRFSQDEGRANARLIASAPETAAERDRFKDTLTKIDAIRNSIIGLQSINWSAHIYPLVAALEEAGFAGEGYDVAKEKQQPMVEVFNRNIALEDERDRLLAVNAKLLKACKWAEAALAPFSKEPAEKSGINMLRAVIKSAEASHG